MTSSQRIRWPWTTALLAVSGFVTFKLYAAGEQASYTPSFLANAWSELRIGLPFGIVTAGLWARPFGRIPLVAFLDCVAWVAAYYTAIALWSRIGAYGAMAAAGLVGALLVTVFAGWGCRKLRSGGPIVQAALVGAVAGIPFAMYASVTPNLDVLAWAFPLWQIAVGGWLHWNTGSTKRDSRAAGAIQVKSQA